MKNDRIVLEVLRNCRRNLLYVLKQIDRGRQISAESANHDGFSLTVASVDIQNDGELVMEGGEINEKL